MWLIMIVNNHLVVFMWLLYGDYMVIICLLYGYYMVIIWLLYA
jgi:hypothetical protein